MKHLKSLREYIDALSVIGEIQPISQEVDWNLEMGAITRRCNELGAPAPLFNNVKGIEKGFRALGAPAGISRQKGKSLVRVAVSLGLHPDASGKEIVEALAAARLQTPVPPIILENGPCKENKMLGSDVDLLRFPAPVPHAGDGGRYINTYGIIVARTPDTKWTSWSIARIMIVDRNKMTGIVHPLQHVGMVHKAWKEIGKPMPFAIALGVEPAIPFVGGMPLPALMNEADYLGGFLGAAIEVVRCETVDLEVPATSEIVIEGTLSNNEASLEGPMGEYAGYLFNGPGHYQPTYHVSAITYRNDPILPIVVAGEPVEEDHTAWGIPAAAEVLAELRQNGIPATLAWIPLESAIHWLVITLPRDWKARLGYGQDGLIQAIAKVVFSSKASIPIPKVLIVNDDIDPTNLNELVWAFATRNHPTSGEFHFNTESISPLVAFYKSAEKSAGVGPKVIYSLLPPEEWGDVLPTRSSFRFSYPPELQHDIIDKWGALGFTE